VLDLLDPLGDPSAHVHHLLLHMSQIFTTRKLELINTFSCTFLTSIPGGVTKDFFSGTPDRTRCTVVDSASESEYQGFLLR